MRHLSIRRHVRSYILLENKICYGSWQHRINVQLLSSFINITKKIGRFKCLAMLQQTTNMSISIQSLTRNIVRTISAYTHRVQFH